MKPTEDKAYKYVLTGYFSKKIYLSCISFLECISEVFIVSKSFYDTSCCIVFFASPGLMKKIFKVVLSLAQETGFKLKRDFSGNQDIPYSTHPLKPVESIPESDFMGVFSRPPESLDHAAMILDEAIKRFDSQDSVL